MTSMMDILKEKLDPESLRKLADVRSAVEGRFMKLADGQNLVRIMPSWKKDGLWFREVRNHFKVGGGERNRVAVCSATEDPPQKCFIDEVITFLAMSPSAVDQESARNMKASRVFWMNAYDANSKEPVVKILPLSFTVFGQIFQLFLSGEDFVDPVNGFNVVITKNPGNRYNVRLERQTSAIADGSLLDQLHDLDVVVKDQVRSYEEQKAFFPAELVKQMEGGLKPAQFFEGTGDITPALEGVKKGKEVADTMKKLAAAVSSEAVKLQDVD